MNEQSKIYIQAFSIREELSKDLNATLDKVIEIGFAGIEAMLLPMQKQGKLPHYLWSKELLEQAMTLCKDKGLEVYSAHMGFGLGPIRFPAKTIISYINEVRQKYGIRYYIFSGLFNNESSAASAGKLLRKVAAATKDSGAVILYHNHDDEFYPFLKDGMSCYPMDVFLKYAGEDVKLQLDIGWAEYAKSDLFFYERYHDRIVSIHCKDFYDPFKDYTNKNDIPASLFAPIGEGAVHTEMILKDYLDNDLSLKHIAIDQDKFSSDCYEQLKTGYQNLCSYLEKEPEKIVRSLPEKENVSLNKEKLSLMTFSLEMDKALKRMSIDDIVSLAADDDIHRIDVMNIKGKDLPAYITALHTHDVKVKCYIANVSFFNKEDKILETLQQQMSIANALKAPLFMIVPYLLPSELSKAKKMGRQETKEKLIQGFKIAVEEGKKRDLTVTFETTPHDELCLSSAEDCEYVLGHVEGLKLVYDTANMLPSGEDPLTYYERLKQYIVHVHLKDVLLTKGKVSTWSEADLKGRLMKCCLWGQGVIPIDEIYQRMIEDGYEGCFAIEYAHPDGIAKKEVHKKQLQKHFAIFQ